MSLASALAHYTPTPKDNTRNDNDCNRSPPFDHKVVKENTQEGSSLCDLCYIRNKGERNAAETVL